MDFYSALLLKNMEGPSLLILKEELRRFTGKTITESSGLSKINHQLLAGKKIKEIKTWGKHFLIVFRSFTIRLHFLMFGSYRINERKATTPRLSLKFENGEEINFYTTAVTWIEEELDEVYEWSADVLNMEWNPKKARKKLKQQPETSVSDALLDQNIFAGVGNIIKNEVLYRIHVHPNSNIGALPPRKLTELITEARQYSFDFYNWKKVFQLKKHWLIYSKKKCKRCNLPAIKEYTGKSKRRSFFCSNCQTLYQ
jgi:endonuclease-8